MSIFFKQRSVSFQASFASGADTATAANPGTIEAALRLVPVYAATSLIADQIAAAPWAVYRKSSTIPERLATQPALAESPGVHVDRFAWIHQLAASLLLRGNAYGLIVDVDSAGTPSKIQWLRPDEMTVDETAPRPQFSYRGKAIAADSIVHIPAFVLPGSMLGLSPIALFKLQIETGMQAQMYAERFLNNNGQPSGILQNKQKTLTDVDADTAKKRFKVAIEKGDMLVTGSDWEYSAMSLPNSEAQFIAGVRITANQIAAAFRVAPEDVGGESGGSSLTYKNLEQDQIRFAIRTLRPWTARIEAALSAYLPADQYIRFNLDSGARADISTRYKAHATGIAAGFLTVDEARALEERAPLKTAPVA